MAPQPPLAADRGDHAWFKGEAPDGVTRSAFLQAHREAAAEGVPAALLFIPYGAAASVLLRSAVGGPW